MLAVLVENLLTSVLHTEDHSLKIATEKSCYLTYQTIILRLTFIFC